MEEGEREREGKRERERWRERGGEMEGGREREMERERKRWRERGREGEGETERERERERGGEGGRIAGAFSFHNTPALSSMPVVCSASDHCQGSPELGGVT